MLVSCLLLQAYLRVRSDRTRECTLNVAREIQWIGFSYAAV